MLTGEYQYTLDPKGRLNFPARLREELGDRFVVTKGLDGCLFVYGMEEWQRILEKLRELPLSSARHLQRFLASGAAEVEPDKQGRILIPAELKKQVFIDKELVTMGAMRRIEIWSKEVWENPEAYKPETDNSYISELTKYNF